MTHRSLLLPVWCALAIAAAPARFGLAAVPPAEKLLPDDTLVVLTTPDFSRLRSIWEKMPQHQLWNDSSMKAFREDFLSKWKEQFVKPLERELDIKFDDYTPLLQGQLTIALTQNGWQGDGQPAGLLLLLDTKDKSSQLKKNLSALRKKWADSGKAVKSTKIRDIEFTTVPISTNDIPKTLRRFFPKPSETQEAGEEESAKPAEQPDELVVGQIESLLLISNSPKAAERVVARMTGGSVPPLSDVATYQADHAALFREAPLYGWMNLKVLLDVLTRKLAEKKENAEAPNPFDLRPEKILGAIGLNGLNTLAFNFQQSNEGSLLQFSLGAPESSRRGLFKLLAGEPRDSRPPPFVPGDAVKFERWRIDGQKTWDGVQKIVNDISPQWLSGINFLLETANTAAKEKDPGFDIKKNLIGNIGDDIITYEKAPRDKSAAELRSPPSLFLLGSPRAEALAAALKSVRIFAGQQSGSGPDEREFLGRKIYSVSLKGLMVPLGGGSGPAVPRTLNYAASGGYVAFSSDAAVIEEYLRSSEGQRNSLRDIQGLNDAAQRVTSSGSSLFGYENQVETTRATLEQLKKNPHAASAGPSAGPAAGLLQNGVNVPAVVQNFKDLADFSLLPDFDSISKYFHFMVYGGGSSVDGLWVKVFSPTPPRLKNP